MRTEPSEDADRMDANKCVVCGAPITAKWEEMGERRRVVKTCPVDWRHNEANAKASEASPSRL